MGNAFGANAIKPMETVAVPESFPPILKKLTKVIMKMELQKLSLHPVSNPLLQTLLLVLHRKDQSLCMKLCKAVMSQIDMFSSKRGKIKGPRESKELGEVDEGVKEQERWVCSQNIKIFFEMLLRYITVTACPRRRGCFGANKPCAISQNTSCAILGLETAADEFSNTSWANEV